MALPLVVDSGFVPNAWTGRAETTADISAERGVSSLRN